MTADPPTQAPTVLDYARRYLELGYHPIPLGPRTKRPPLVDWKRYQDTPPTDAELERWFISGKNNIGLVLGRGKIAVDCDGPGAEDLLIKAGVEIPMFAPRSKTAHGCHIVLEVSEPLGDRVGLLESPERHPDNPKKPLSAVDIRGVGYIVAPPSIHPSGHQYEWVVRPSDELPTAPKELVDLIKRTSTAASSTASPSPASSTPSDAPKWVTEALKGVGEGRRDQTCARLAGYFFSKPIPLDVIRQLLYGWADRCTPPFPKAEVDKTVASISTREAATHRPDDPDTSAAANAEDPFQILGYNHGSYFYLPTGSLQVVELRAEHHTKLKLLSLAPLYYWERKYMGREGVRWDMAANALIRLSEAAGVYDTARVRGRGAWWDEEPLVHMGDQLVVNGRATPIAAARRTRYIYEAAAPMPISLDNPLTPDEAYNLLTLSDLISWERPISSRFLAGWIVLAPICGALTWRPHIWLTGPAGSGKTWVMDHIIRPAVGEVGLAVQSETTEAGLRQTLGHDARPIIFDEAEGENERAQVRIQNILALARQASSETGAIIIKGTTGGIAKTYRIRSCFAFSSIGVGVNAHADATRVAVLSMLSSAVVPDAAAKFARLEKAVASTITEQFVSRLRARSISLIPQIRANARTFATAAAAVIGSQRAGDQVGALLSGAYSLFSDDIITPTDALTWVEKQDWTEQKGVQEAADELLCLNRILEHVVRVQTKSYTGERSIAELIAIAAMKKDDPLTLADAQDYLGRVGIRVTREEVGDCFLVSNSHAGIGAILQGSPWVKGWPRLLRRIAGAQAIESPIRFAGIRSRAVAVPLELAC